MKYLTIPFCAALAAIHSFAAEPPDGSATNTLAITPALIGRLLAEARTNHPALRAQDARTEAAGWNTAAVRTWEDPVFKLGGSIFSRRGSKVSEEGDLIYGLEQKLPLFGKAERARRVAAAETAMQEAETEYRVRQLRRDLIAQLVKFARAERQLEISRQDFAWLETIATVTEEKYRNSLATQLDVLTAQNEKSKRADRLLTEEKIVTTKKPRSTAGSTGRLIPRGPRCVCRLSPRRCPPRRISSRRPRRPRRDFRYCRRRFFRRRPSPS